MLYKQRLVLSKQLFDNTANYGNLFLHANTEVHQYVFLSVEEKK